MEGPPMTPAARFPALALSAAALLALAACAEEPAEETTYEPAVEDVGGGELQVADPDAQGVPVDVPETPMTNVPAEPTESAQPAE